MEPWPLNSSLTCFSLPLITFKTIPRVYLVYGRSNLITRLVHLCVHLFACFLHQNILQLWPFPSLYVKPVNKAKSHGKRVEEQQQGTSSFVKACHRLLREKLMDLFSCPIVLEQSNDSMGRGVPVYVGEEFHSCAVVSPEDETFTFDLKK